MKKRRETKQLNKTIMGFSTGLVWTNEPVESQGPDFMVLFCFVWDTVSLGSYGRPGTHYIDQADLKLTELCLVLPTKCWD